MESLGTSKVLSTLLHNHAAIESSLGPETNVLLLGSQNPKGPST